LLKQGDSRSLCRIVALEQSDYQRSGKSVTGSGCIDRLMNTHPSPDPERCIHDLRGNKVALIVVKPTKECDREQ
jgi:hypothetical protein